MIFSMERKDQTTGEQGQERQSPLMQALHQRVLDLFSGVGIETKRSELERRANDIVHFALEEHLDIIPLLEVFNYAAGVLLTPDPSTKPGQKPKPTPLANQKELAKLVLKGNGRTVKGFDGYFCQADIVVKAYRDFSQEQDYTENQLQSLIQKTLENKRLLMRKGGMGLTKCTEQVIEGIGEQSKEISTEFPFLVFIENTNISQQRAELFSHIITRSENGLYGEKTFFAVNRLLELLKAESVSDTQVQNLLLTSLGNISLNDLLSKSATGSFFSKALMYISHLPKDNIVWQMLTHELFFAQRDIQNGGESVSELSEVSTLKQLLAFQLEIITRLLAPSIDKQFSDLTSEDNNIVSALEALSPFYFPYFIDTICYTLTNWTQLLSFIQKDLPEGIYIALEQFHKSLLVKARELGFVSAETDTTALRESLLAMLPQITKDWQDRFSQSRQINMFTSAFSEYIHDPDGVIDRIVGTVHFTEDEQRKHLQVIKFLRWYQGPIEQGIYLPYIDSEKPSEDFIFQRYSFDITGIAKLYKLRDYSKIEFVLPSDESGRDKGYILLTSDIYPERNVIALIDKQSVIYRFINMKTGKDELLERYEPLIALSLRRLQEELTNPTAEEEMWQHPFSREQLASISLVVSFFESLGEGLMLKRNGIRENIKRNVYQFDIARFTKKRNINAGTMVVIGVPLSGENGLVHFVVQLQGKAGFGGIINDKGEIIDFSLRPPISPWVTDLIQIARYRTLFLEERKEISVSDTNNQPITFVTQEIGLVEGLNQTQRPVGVTMNPNEDYTSYTFDIRKLADYLGFFEYDQVIIRVPSTQGNNHIIEFRSEDKTRMLGGFVSGNKLVYAGRNQLSLDSLNHLFQSVYPRLEEYIVQEKLQQEISQSPIHPHTRLEQVSVDTASQILGGEDF